MTKQESTHKRNKEFSMWIRNNLPDAFTGYRCYDVDYVLWQKEDWKIKKIMIIEEKVGSSQVTVDQKLTLEFLSRAISNQAKEEGIEYLGTHLIRLETGNPDTGTVWLDNNEISKEELQNFLSFKYSI